MNTKKSIKKVTANLCTGCRENKSPEITDATKNIFCEVAVTFIAQQFATFPVGEKCRDKLCSYLRATKRVV